MSVAAKDSSSGEKEFDWKSISEMRSDLPLFRPGDTVKVHTKIIEGTKERIQVFQGVVIKVHKNRSPEATFTVRKVSYNIGVERTFSLHSPRLAKIEIVNRGKVRRARLFYLRPLRGKATRIKSKHYAEMDEYQQMIDKETMPPAAETAEAEAAPETPKDNG